MPITKVFENETQGYVDDFNDDITSVIREDLLGSAGMPLSVQVVGRPWMDEAVLGVMKTLS